MTYALVGNQNCGKTTVFNRLTGENAHEGNFPGVTVDIKSGFCRWHRERVIDLPGIYSMSSYTPEERITVEAIERGGADCIINIVDATNIERNLYLTLQLLSLGKPMIIALNMMDEAEKSGTVIDISGLGKRLGVEVVATCAKKNRGIRELTEAARRAVQRSTAPKPSYGGAVEKALSDIQYCEHCTRYTAEKILSGEIGVAYEDIADTLKECERETGLDGTAALASARYGYIDALLRECVCKGERKKRCYADLLLTHRFLGIPLFFALITGIFYITFSVVGGGTGEIIARFGERLSADVTSVLYSFGAHGYTVRLITEGILRGLIAVAGFLPTVLTLFFFMSFLEDSGYMARAAFVFDRPMRSLGLSGRSLVPFIMGFGCSVPAITATRTIKSKSVRERTVRIIPFASCSAKIVIYGAVADACFPGHAGIVTASLYIIGIAVGMLYTKIAASTKKKGSEMPFILELPPYRLPSIISVFRNIKTRTVEFMKRVFSIILICSIIIWILESMDFTLRLCLPEESILAFVGRAAGKIFKPLGFSDWRLAAALLTGLGAKENVIGTLCVLTARDGLAALFVSHAAAYAFLAFSLLYTPCAAAMCAMSVEVGRRRAAVTALTQAFIAYAVACAAYLIGSAVL